MPSKNATVHVSPHPIILVLMYGDETHIKRCSPVAGKNYLVVGCTSTAFSGMGNATLGASTRRMPTNG